ncbi:hypothetical protein H4Q32_022635 [Labeo rohita]|uniref:Uncharacterized protein n=1 Tax=Labeo rohita TaxID=84645 RepID=A0ABQ8MB03_LABRO|nr:hypothetical protein H4Q32_022635 [Labeo rohita]
MSVKDLLIWKGSAVYKRLADGALSQIKCPNGRDFNWQLIVASTGSSVRQPRERSEFNAFSTTLSARKYTQQAHNAASQATSTPQDPPTEPAAASQGRRPSCATAAHTSRRRITPSPPPSKRQPSSPASSYTSALSSAPAKGKAGLRQALASSGVIIPHRSTKADLLYASLQAGENPNSTPRSRASGRACTGRSAPYSWPEQTTTPPRAASWPSGRSDRPSASLGHAPKDAVASHRPPPRSSEQELAAHAGREPVFTSTSRHSGASPPPPAEKSRSQLLPRYSPNPLPYPWPTAPPSNRSTSFPPLMAQAPAPMPAIPSLFPPFSSIPQNAHSTSMPLPAVPAATFPPQTRSPFSPASATPLPAPPNVLALEPPPIPNSIRTQILAGADVDLFSLLSPISPSPADRQINCGKFSVTLKNSTNNQSRILSFAEFTIAFTRYSEVICATFPHRRRELSDYLTIVAELALSYGVCHSFSHSTPTCSFINPSISPCPESSQPKSTGYVPRLMDTPATPTPTFRRCPSFTDSQNCFSTLTLILQIMFFQVLHTASTLVSKVSPPKVSSAQISSPLSPNPKQ